MPKLRVFSSGGASAPVVFDGPFVLAARPTARSDSDNMNKLHSRPVLARVQRAMFLVLALLTFVAPSLAGEQALTSILLRVDLPDGTPLPEPESPRAIVVTAEVEGEFGWPLVHRLWLRPAEQEEAGWQILRVPRGAELRLSVFKPPHPLLERVIQLDPERAEQRIHLTLADPVPTANMGVQVELPPNAPPWAERFMWSLIGPRTGHELAWTTLGSYRRSLLVPRGTYDVKLSGLRSGGCGNEPPTAHWMTPAIQSGVVVRAASQGEDAAVLQLAPMLQPERGARLDLRVLRPELPPGVSAPEAQAWNAGEPWSLFGQFARNVPEPARVRLVALADGEVHDLTWGWRNLNFVLPRPYFPLGEDVYQIVPVPAGEYELILRGRGIEELRRKVTLVEREVLKLELQPRAAR